jgi:hypothetical protein
MNRTILLGKSHARPWRKWEYNTKTNRREIVRDVRNWNELGQYRIQQWDFVININISVFLIKL